MFFNATQVLFLETLEFAENKYGPFHLCHRSEIMASHEVCGREGQGLSFLPVTVTARRCHGPAGGQRGCGGLGGCPWRRKGTFVLHK